MTPFCGVPYSPSTDALERAARARARRRGCSRPQATPAALAPQRALASAGASSTAFARARARSRARLLARSRALARAGARALTCARVGVIPNHVTRHFNTCATNNLRATAQPNKSLTPLPPPPPPTTNHKVMNKRVHSERNNGRTQLASMFKRA